MVRQICKQKVAEILRPKEDFLGKFCNKLMTFTSFYFPQLFVVKSVKPLTQRPIEKSISLVKGAELSD